MGTLSDFENEKLKEVRRRDNYMYISATSFCQSFAHKNPCYNNIMGVRCA